MRYRLVEDEARALLHHINPRGVDAGGQFVDAQYRAGERGQRLAREGDRGQGCEVAEHFSAQVEIVLVGGGRKVREYQSGGVLDLPGRHLGEVTPGSRGCRPAGRPRSTVSRADSSAPTNADSSSAELGRVSAAVVLRRPRSPLRAQVGWRRPQSAKPSRQGPDLPAADRRLVLRCVADRVQHDVGDVGVGE